MNYFDMLIESDTVKLVPFNTCYAEDIFNNFTPKITKYMFPVPAKNIGETIAFINHGIDASIKGTDIYLIILDKETNEFIGCVGLHNITKRCPELGIWTKLSSHGHHYGRNACTILAKYGIQNYSFDGIIYPVDFQNIPSRLIPESMGGIIVKTSKLVKSSNDTLFLVEYFIDANKLR